MDINLLRNNGKPWKEWELLLLAVQPATNINVRACATILKRSEKSIRHMWAKLYWSEEKLISYRDKYPKMADHYQKILNARREAEIAI